MTALLSAAEWAVVGLSLKVSLMAVLVSLPLAYALAWLLSRRRFPGRLLLDALVHLPLVVPPVVIGWGLLILFGRSGPLGAWLEQAFGITLVFRWTGAALAAAVMALPLMVRAMRLSIEGVDRRLVGAARSLGAGPWRAFATITLPLSMPGILAAAVLGFARSLGEFGATITFASNIEGQTRTLPLAIYSGLQIPGAEAQVTRLAVISILLSLGALLVSEALVRRSAGRARMSFDIALRCRVGGGREIAFEMASNAALTALVGPSGAGKTTILNCIAGLVRPDTGRIAVAGEVLVDRARGIDLPPERRRAGYVFQDARLFPHMRVARNLTYGERLAAPGERWIGADEVIGLLGIGPLLDRWPATLSGGETRRVAIGRALLAGPRFLLLDEPMASLDAARAEGIRALVEDIRDTLRLPILLVSHDLAEVNRLAGRVVTIE